MVSNLSLSEKLQSRLSRSFHASRALRFVPKSLRFLFWNFRKRSSCFLLVRLPSISRKSLDSRSLDFYAMKFSWFLPFSGTVRFFSEHLLFYHLLSCLSATFLFFPSFFLALRGRSHLTACLYYQIIPSLSTPFSKLFYLFFSPPVYTYRPAIHVPLKNKTPD